MILKKLLILEETNFEKPREQKEIAKSAQRTKLFLKNLSYNQFQQTNTRISIQIHT